jgi:hypothetical protein
MIAVIIIPTIATPQGIAPAFARLISSSDTMLKILADIPAITINKVSPILRK